MQQLPANESFDVPAWIKGATSNTVPYFWWYMGFAASQNSASAPSDCPWASTGPLAVNRFSKIVRAKFPQPMPALMASTDSNQEQQRAMLARHQDAFAVEDLTWRVDFGLYAFNGSGPLGFAAGNARNTAQQVSFPAGDEANTDPDHLSLGGWDGGVLTISPGARPIGGSAGVLAAWQAWRGNSLFFRVGGSYVTPEWSAALYHEPYVRNATGYAFGVFPVVNQPSARVDLRAELWQFKALSASGTSSVIWRKVAQQLINGGAPGVEVVPRYHLRVEVDTNASGYVEINAFMGPYTRGGTTYPEVQFFKAGVFDNDTFTLGSDVAQNTATGLIEDRHVDRVTDYLDRTCGWSQGRDRRIDVGAYNNPGSPTPDVELVSVNDGIWSLESSRTSTGGVRYRDEWVRSSSTIGGLTYHEPVVNQFNVEGVLENGLWSMDTATRRAFSGNQRLQPLMRESTNATSVASALPDGVAIGLNSEEVSGWYLAPTANVPRAFVHQRPATQFYNHDRTISFKPGAETGVEAIGVYEFGLQLRGSINGTQGNGLCAMLFLTTDGAGVVTVARLRIVERQFLLNTVNPWNLGTIIAERTWDDDVADFNATWPVYDGSYHTLRFITEVPTNAPSPSTTASYRVELDGLPVNLSDTGNVTQSVTTSPYDVLHNGPTFVGGYEEAVIFSALYAHKNASNVARYGLWGIKDWTEGTLPDEPDTGGGASATTIAVNDEGAAVGFLNVSGGALAFGTGVWDVEVTVSIRYEWPINRIEYASGHQFTAPTTTKPRRTWEVEVVAMDTTIYQALLAFFEDHRAGEVPFNFRVPMLSSGEGITQDGQVEDVVAVFGVDDLEVRLVAPGTYSAAFSIVEVIYT